MMSSLKPVLLVVAVVVAAGTGWAREHGANSTTSSDVEKTCFRVRNTRGFSALDDRFVYVRCIRDAHYLLTMENRCYGLEYSIKIAISNEFDRVCSDDGATITYRDFSRADRCRILTVEAVAGLEQAEAIVRERTTARRTRGTE